MVLIAYAQKPPIKVHADVLRETRGLNFGRSLHLHPYNVYTITEGSGESAHILCADSHEPSLHDNAIKYQNACVSCTAKLDNVYTKVYL